MSHTQLRADATRVRDVIERVGALLSALNLGIERLESEVDYSDPANAVALLENRDMTVNDYAAVELLVREDPGPLYYGDLDLCEDGGSWETSGGPWADRLQKQLTELGAISERATGHDEQVDDDLALQVKRALEGDSNDAEHEALVGVAARFGIPWQHPDV
jgi:hypothetical protein